MPDRARRLSEASISLLSELDVDRVMDTVVDAMCDIMRADAASISLIDSDGKHFDLVASRGLSERYVRSQKVPAEAGRRMYTTPDQHLIVRLDESPLGDRALFREERLAIVAAFPLVRADELIGSLNAYLRDPAASFTAESLELGHVLAVEASVAIANARMYQQAVAQRERETSLIASLGTPVIVGAPTGEIVTMNQAYRDLIGLDTDDRGARFEELFARMRPRDAVTGEPVARALMIDAFAGKDREAEIAFTRLGTGEERIVEVSVRAVRDPQGTVVAAVAALHDLTELRRLEQDKDRFLSIVSHELRTPLTPLKALAQLLVGRIRRSRARGEPPDLESLERNLATIERQVDRMNGLVSDLLSVSRAGRGRLELDVRPFDLASSVRGVVDRYVEATREEGRHHFRIETPEQLVVMGDEGRVEQMLMNLIGNAVKYSPRGGDVRVSLARDDGKARIEIADNGIGIPAADMPHLGGAFTRGSGKAATFAGMGIGLHVARLLADAHGGALEIESAGEDRGTTVRVTLPA